jgi:hypothetical protein
MDNVRDLRDAVYRPGLRHRPADHDPVTILLVLMVTSKGTAAVPRDSPVVVASTTSWTWRAPPRMCWAMPSQPVPSRNGKAYCGLGINLLFQYMLWLKVK